MYVLKNKGYYIVIPPCPLVARKLIAAQARELHPKELKHAKMSKMNVSQYEMATAGTLKIRGL